MHLTCLFLPFCKTVEITSTRCALGLQAESQALKIAGQWLGTVERIPEGQGQGQGQEGHTGSKALCLESTGKQSSVGGKRESDGFEFVTTGGQWQEISGFSADGVHFLCQMGTEVIFEGGDSRKLES